MVPVCEGRSAAGQDFAGGRKAGTLRVPAKNPFKTRHPEEPLAVAQAAGAGPAATADATTRAANVPMAPEWGGAATASAATSAGALVRVLGQGHERLLCIGRGPAPMSQCRHCSSGLSRTAEAVRPDPDDSISPIAWASSAVFAPALAVLLGRGCAFRGCAFFGGRAARLARSLAFVTSWKVWLGQITGAG